jgi:F-type H+-transporting ATPase subunit b
MKIPVRWGKRKLGPMGVFVMVIAVAVMVSLVPAWASSGGSEHGTEGAVAHGGEGGAAHGGEGGGAHGGGHGAMSKPWNKKDTAKVLNFAVLAIGLFLLLRKPVSQALSGRIKGIKEELEDLENRKVQVEKQLADYNTKLAQLDKEAEGVVAEYIRQGEEAKARILKEAESAAEKLKEQAQKNIQNEFNQAKQRLQAEIVEKALAKAEQLIKDRISADDQDRLVDEYLEKVVA